MRGGPLATGTQGIGGVEAEGWPTPRGREKGDRGGGEEEKRSAPSGNRTRGISMATRYFTTKPTALGKNTINHSSQQTTQHTQQNTYNTNKQTHNNNNIHITTHYPLTISQYHNITISQYPAPYILVLLPPMLPSPLLHSVLHMYIDIPFSTQKTQSLPILYRNTQAFGIHHIVSCRYQYSFTVQDRMTRENVK